MIYAIARGFARLLLAIFYRRVAVVGVHRVPRSGPVLVVANHHNALVDPLLLLAALPRRLVPVAKAPLFSHPVMGPLLRAVSAIPVERRQDRPPGAAADPDRNAEMFRRAGDVLRADGAILVFPEGVSQPEPILMPIRTGAARMVLAAASAGAVPALLPVGLVYEAPATFRAGPALAIVGPPIDTGDLPRGPGVADDAAVRELTRRIAAALRALIVEARDAETADLLAAVERLAEQEGALSGRDAGARAAWRRRAAAALAGADDDERGERLRDDLRRLLDDLGGAGLTGHEIAPAYPARAVLRYAWRQTSALLFALPAALLGLMVHAVPYRLTALAVAGLRGGAEMAATYKLAVGTVVYPLCWATEGWLAWRVGGPWLLGAFCAILIPGGLVALAWQERWADYRRRALGLLHYLAHRDHHGHLVARRRAVVTELQALMARAPAAGGLRGA